MDKLLGGHYQFIKVLGTHELGHTYLVTDVHHPDHPYCVVKQIRLSSKNPKTLQFILSFIAKKSAILEKLGQHDQIPRLLTYFEENQEFYLVQEFVPGDPLTTELIPGHPWYEDRVIDLLEELLEILVFVHGQGVFSGCIKPSNIIRRHGDGKLVLTNLGIVKEISSLIVQLPEPSVQSPVRDPTPYLPTYLSPGQLPVSGDLYTLGIIGIQAITGLSAKELADCKRLNNGSGEILVWRDRTPVSPDLEAILDKMVHCNRHPCYHQAATVLADLRQLTTGHVIPQVSQTQGLVDNPSSHRRPRVRPWFAIAIVAILILGGLTLTYLLQLPQRLLAQSFLNQGLTQEQAGENQQAITLYTKAIELQPTKSTAYYQRGITYSRLGEFQKALADLTQAIQLNPNDAQAYYQRGTIRLHLGENHGAKTDYTQGIQLDPNLTAAYLKRGKVQADLGEHEAAVKDYTQVIQLEPNRVDAYLNRCFSRSHLGDQNGAIEDCTQVINLRANNPFAYQNRGLARHRRGDIRGAIEDYNQAIQLAPDQADPYYNRGLARQDLGDLPGAIADYTQALKRHPHYALAYYNRGLLQAQQQNQQAAILDLQQAAKLCLDQNQLSCYEDAQNLLNQLQNSD